VNRISTASNQADYTSRAAARAAAASAKASAPKWDLLLIAVALMLLTYLWRFQSVFPLVGMLQVTSLATLAAYGLYFLDGDPRRKIVYLANPVSYAFLALILVMFLSIPLSLGPTQSFRFMFPHFIKTILFTLLVAASVRDVTDVERFLGAFVFGGAIYGAMIVMTGGPEDTAGRPVGFGGYDANDYAMHMVVALPMAAYFVTKAKGRIFRYSAAFAALFMVAAVVVSSSRGGFLALVAVFGYWLVFYTALPRKARIAVGLLVLVAGMSVASDEYWERMATLLNPTQDYNWAGRSDTGRLEVWKRALGYMGQRPLLGVGIGRFGTAEGRLSELARERERMGMGLKWSSAHNSYLEVGAELGVTGLLIFLTLFALAIRMLWLMARPPPNAASQDSREVALAQSLIGSMIAYLVAGMFLSQAYADIPYVLIGLAVGLTKTHFLAQGSLPTARRLVAPAQTSTATARASRSSRRSRVRRSRRLQPR
jgi:probable O-glycosylation ligase (exosortase A-associated)